MEMGDGKVAEWLNGYRNVRTRAVVSRIFNKFMEWLSVNGGELSGKSPTEIWKMQRELNRQNILNEDVNNRLILNVVLDYIETGGDWTSGYKRRVFYTIKSFIDYPNGGALPPVLNGEKMIFRSEKSVDTVEMETFRQTVRDVVGACDNCHRAIYSIMAVSGMGPGEVVYLSGLGLDYMRRTLSNPVSRDPEVIEIKLPSRKGNVGRPYHTYVGGAPLRFLKNYLDERTEMKSSQSELFLTNFGTPVRANNVQEYWKCTLVRLRKYKVQPGRGGKRTGQNPHLLRHLFRTSWSISRARREVGEYSMGHFEKLPYDEITKSQKVRVKEYLKALPHLDLWTDVTITPADEKIEELQRTIELMRPAFNMAQRMLEERREWDRLRDPPPASGANVSFK